MPPATPPSRSGVSGSATVRAARELADELFTSAPEIDATGVLPRSRLDALAAAGLYGVSLDAELVDLAAVVEALAGGCLASTFVWLQHLGTAPAVAASHTPGMAERVPALHSGELRAGVALSGLRAGPMQVAIEPVNGGFRVDGTVGWLTGWGLIDVVQLAGRGADGTAFFLLVDAAPDPRIEVRPLELMAIQAGSTVSVTFRGLVVPADRLLHTQPADEWAAADSRGSALNGFLSMGVAERCARLLGDGHWTAALAGARDDLLAAADRPEDVPAARARASALAWRAAGALMADGGGRAALAGGHGQRLAREAALLLTFGTRPAIRAELAGLLRP